MTKELIILKPIKIPATFIPLSCYRIPTQILLGYCGPILRAGPPGAIGHAAEVHPHTASSHADQDGGRQVLGSQREPFVSLFKTLHSNIIVNKLHLTGIRKIICKLLVVAQRYRLEVFRSVNS